MFMVVQLRKRPGSNYLQLQRYWFYKTEAGARRRVWLSKQSKDNINVFYFDLSKAVAK